MPSSELRRRIKQRDTLREMITRAAELKDRELFDRRTKALEGVDELVNALQAEADAEPVPERTGRRR